MVPKPSTPAEILGALTLIAAFCWGIVFTWRTRNYLLLALMIVLTVLVLWGGIDMLRHGVRRPQGFERFESGLFARVIVILVGGGVVVALLQRAGYNGAALVGLAIVLVAGLSGANKLRRRDETRAAYQKRIGYREPGRPREGEPDEG